jgi:hypothetical protein
VRLLATRPTTLRARSLLLYAAVALGAALYFFPFVRVLHWCPDEGAYLYGAELVLHGALPGRDFFEQYGPGCFFWLAGVMKIFGGGILPMRGLLLLVGVGSALLLFHISRQIGAKGVLALTFFVPLSISFLMVMNSQHYDGNFFALLAFAVFLAALKRADRPKDCLMALSGMLAGLTSWMIQHKGLLLLFAMLASVPVAQKSKRLRSAVWLLLGFTLVIFAELAPYVAQHAVSNLIYSDFQIPASTYQQVNAVYYGFPFWASWLPRWFDTFHRGFAAPVAMLLTGAVALPFMLVVLAPLLPFLAYLFGWRPFCRELLPFWVAGYALWLSELHRLDIGHLRNGCILLVAIFLSLVETAPSRHAKRAAVAFASCFLLIGGIYVVGALGAKVRIQTRRGTLWADKPDRVMQFLMGHTQPGDYVFVYPYRPVYYYLAELRNPTRVAAYVYSPEIAGIFRQEMQSLDAKKVRYVLFDTNLSGKNMRQVFPAYQPPKPQDEIFEPYLASHYHQIALLDGFRVLERNP